MSFSKRASSYDSGVAGKGSRKLYSLVLQTLELQPGAAVLDVGCGTGALLQRIAGTYDIVGYGIDVEENMIVEAQKKGLQMQFVVGECDKLPYADQSFDALVVCMAYHHFDNKEGFAKEAARVLKPGGFLYIADPRFPWPIRKAINGVLRIIRVVGEFSTADETTAFFSNIGFIGLGAALDGYAQVVKLQRSQERV